LSTFFKVFVESNQAYFHISLITNRWYQDQFFFNSDLMSNELLVSSGPVNENQSTIKHFEAKKAIQYSVQDGDDELLHLIKDYNDRKEQNRVEQERSKKRQHENNNQIITTPKGDIIDLQDIQDSVYHQPKGRIPFKRLKSAAEKTHKTVRKPLTEINNENSGQRRCGMCGNYGHYRNTCTKR
jgi:hypothetical protein